MDKKLKRIVIAVHTNKFIKDGLESQKLYRELSVEDIEYARSKGEINEDYPITNESVILHLKDIFSKITLEEVVNSFLHSLSTRDIAHRYILPSYIYARCWLENDGFKNDTADGILSCSFFSFVKYKGGGIWGGIKKPYYFLTQYINSERVESKDEDVTILKYILDVLDNLDKKDTPQKAVKILLHEKRFPCNKEELVGILESLAICGILETKEHTGFLKYFTPCECRDTGDMRQSLSYPLNWWTGQNGVNFTNVDSVFNIQI